MPEQPVPELLTAEQIAKVLGCKTRAVLNWRKQRIIPAEIARGNFLRFDLERVREALRKDAAGRASGAST